MIINVFVLLVMLENLVSEWYSIFGLATYYMHIALCCNIHPQMQQNQGLEYKLTTFKFKLLPS